MNFTKLESVGNDFILVEATGRKLDWPRVAAAICHRHFGVGGDGLLLLLPSEIADLGMRIFNADGSEAEACGNGLRCLAKYAVERGLVAGGAEEISVATAVGINRTRLYRQGNRVTKIQVTMGTPKFEAKEIPVAVEPDKGNIVDIKFVSNYPVTIDSQELLLSFVSMGNPHAVCFWPKPVSDFPLSQLGPAVERHKLFPNRVNLEVAHVINRKQIEARVWERGVGETLACGTGACAVAVAARLLGYTDNDVDIKLPGGTLEVEWAGVGEVLLSGPVEIVFSGKWPEK